MLGWQKCPLGFFYTMLQKNPNFKANPISENCYRAIIKIYPTLDAKKPTSLEEPEEPYTLLVVQMGFYVPGELLSSELNVLPWSQWYCDSLRRGRRPLVASSEHTFHIQRLERIHKYLLLSETR